MRSPSYSQMGPMGRLESIIACMIPMRKGKMLFPGYALLMSSALVPVTGAAMAQTPIDVQPVKRLTRGNSLGTCGYSPIEREKPYFEKLAVEERTTGSFMKAYTIHAKRGKHVSWFGVVRGISSSGGKLTLLVEHKYFDGMTDCHIMLVSQAGAGDFQATLEADPQKIPALALVRIYGTVKEETNKMPSLTVDYIRVWPWLTFTLTDLGAEDNGNPRWAKSCNLCKSGRVYNPYPTESYYFDVLGDPKDFGLDLKPE
jgi:hypothetical protein